MNNYCNLKYCAMLCESGAKVVRIPMCRHKCESAHVPIVHAHTCARAMCRESKSSNIAQTVSNIRDR